MFALCWCQQQQQTTITIRVIQNELSLIHSIYNFGKIAIITSCDYSLRKISNVVKKTCNLLDLDRIIILGCQNIDGFDSIENRKKMDFDKCKDSLIIEVNKFINKNNDISCILFECTQLTPFSNCIRENTGKPVYDYFTLINFTITGLKEVF